MLLRVTDNKDALKIFYKGTRVLFIIRSSHETFVPCSSIILRNGGPSSQSSSKELQGYIDDLKEENDTLRQSLTQKSYQLDQIAVEHAKCRNLERDIERLEYKLKQVFFIGMQLILKKTR